MKGKIAIIASYARSLVQFRGQLIKDLVAAGWEVVALGPVQEAQEGAKVAALGARFVPYSLLRASLNPMSDLVTFRSLIGALKQEQPDVVLSYTAKPMIYGSLAARRCGVPRILSIVTGLGYAFTRSGMKQRVLKWVQLGLYRRAFRSNELVFFQNDDDRRIFERLRVVAPGQARVVHGSGVDLERFQQTPVPAEPFVFLLIARLLREKGILEYLSAAAQVAASTDRDVRFILVGGEDPNPGGLSGEEITAALGPVEWVGEQDDVVPFLRDCSCYVLPSYREGTLRSTLEALATGRPIITTDAIGCRETVIEGKNGWMVPVGDVEALANAMRRALSLSPSEVNAMGAASRELAEKKFDVKLVNADLLKHLIDA